MPRSCLTLVGLLAVLTTARGLAQMPAEPSVPPPTAITQSPQVPPPPGPSFPAGEALVGEPPQVHQAPPPPDPGPATGQMLPSQALPGQPPQVPPSPGSGPVADKALADKPINLEESAKVPPPVASLNDFMGYRYSTGSLDWIPGGGNQFGMFSIVWDHYQKAGVNNGFDAGLGFHFLSGPDQTDMPARVYDFSLAYQIRDRLGPFGYDVAASVLAASDFKGSAREGILFPSHAVGFLSVRPQTDVVLGVDYLDRGDVKLLPVAGLIWTPSPEMRFEVVFPRPRAVFQLTPLYRLYLSGELGGGSWAIERVAHFDDLATYHDLRVCVGLECLEKDGQRSAFEIGYLFDRRLEYSSGIGDMRLDDAVLLRMVTTF